MKKIRIISKKYDGTLRDEHETYLYAETGNVIITCSLAGTWYFDHRTQQRSRAPDGLLEIYFKDRWYNLWHICEQHSGRNLCYINIAMPAELKDGVLEWVDLDLDYRVHLDKSIELLDEDEFEQNIHSIGYPNHVIAQARQACRQVLKGFNEGNFPFNHCEQVNLYDVIKRGISQQKS